MSAISVPELPNTDLPKDHGLGLRHLGQLEVRPIQISEDFDDQSATPGRTPAGSGRRRR